MFVYFGMVVQIHFDSVLETKLIRRGLRASEARVDRLFGMFLCVLM